MSAPSMLTRCIPVESVRAIRAEGVLGEETNVYEFVAATENPIRTFDWERGEVVREILPMTGLRAANYDLNPVVLDCHRKGGSEYVVGKTVARQTENGKLVVRIEFDDEPGSCGARNLRLVRKDMLRTLSVGYTWDSTEHVGKDERSGEAIVSRTAWDLIEISTAPVPADPDALKRSYEEARMSTEKNPEVTVTATTGTTVTIEESGAAIGNRGHIAPEPSVEEELAAARKVALAITGDAALADALALRAMGADDPAEFTARLDQQRRLLECRALDAELREAAGRELAKSDDPLSFSVLVALRQALVARSQPVMTPEPPHEPTTEAPPQEESQRSTPTQKDGPSVVFDFLGAF